MRDLGPNLSGKPAFVASHFYDFRESRVAIPERLMAVVRSVRTPKESKTLTARFPRTS